MRRSSEGPQRFFALASLAFASLGLFFTLPAPASASQQVIDYFGGPSGSGTKGGEFHFPEGIAVNNSSAGPADKSDVYVVDSRNNRIERFARDDNGTPAEPYDDSYNFLSAWGAGVESGGGEYEICTVASACKEALASDGDGTTAGDGALKRPSQVAVDQDTGDVYVSDAGNFRVNVYSGTGTFLRSFGWDVVASGPDNSGGDYEVCVAANGDVCKAGLAGAGAGQIGGGETYPVGIAVSQANGNPATGTVFIADANNHRVDTFGLDGSSPSSFGSSVFSAFGFGWSHPTRIAVDSRGIVYASNIATDPKNVNHIEYNGVERYDSENADGGGVGFLPRIPEGVNEVQEVKISAGAGQFKLSFEGDTTTDLPFNATSSAVKSALEALPSIGPRGAEVKGGPGDAAGSSPYTVSFEGEAKGLAATDVEQLAASNGTTPLSGGAGASVSTKTQGESGILPSTNGEATQGIAVDSDTDGAGPDADTLYVLRNQRSIQRFGPLNAPGLSAPPVAADEKLGGTFSFQPDGLSLDEADGRLYVSSAGINGFDGHGVFNGHGVYIFGVAGGALSASLDSVDNITATSATLHATVNPNGPPALRYHFEYSTDGSNWLSTPETLLGIQETPQAINFPLNPLGAGLAPGTLYHVRLGTKKGFGSPQTTPELTFTTLAAAPVAETSGAPIRSTGTAQLGGRIDPRGAATTYHFEYGDQGPCESNPCTSTSTKAAGAGSIDELIDEEIEGLIPATVYHYRLVAENGVGSPVFGEDMTVSTRASDAPLSHGHLPGPPGSDRAYEQVSTPDTGGNPVNSALGFSANGNRALYMVFGGTPESNTGSLLSLFFAEREESAEHVGRWATKPIVPPREELGGPSWLPPNGTDDLSTVLGINSTTSFQDWSLWHLSPEGAAVKLFAPVAPQEYQNWQAMADDSPRTVALLSGGGLDPTYPSAGATKNLYDITSGEPKLVSILPDGTPPGCGVPAGISGALFQVGSNVSRQSEGWVSPDGSKAFFVSEGDSCSGEPQLYVRNIAEGTTELLSGPPLSGPSCGSALIRAIPGAVFFWTKSRLTPDDQAVNSCEPVTASGGDVYRRDLSDGSLECVTCAPGLPADVFAESKIGGAESNIAVAPDGSRVYFQSASPTPLLPGAVAAASGSTYRVNVKTGDLRWIGAEIRPGDSASVGNAISNDGSTIVFRSDDAGLNPLGGDSTNAGTEQYYRYDDDDRSLLCVSCPQDGTAPAAAASNELLSTFLGEPQTGPNLAFLADDGTVAFSTPTPLVGADQNTPGPEGNPASGEDVYEWRDGRQLLVTDGLTSWVSPPVLQGISHSGRDVYFVAPAQYTPDALDGYYRLYDARIGGGFEFPPPPKPCPLEVCQGTPKGAPEEEQPGTSSFSGQGNVVGRHNHNKHRHKKRRHHKKIRHHRHQADRRTAR